jgi:hypothetical protein
MLLSVLYPLPILSVLVCVIILIFTNLIINGLITLDWLIIYHCVNWVSASSPLSATAPVLVKPDSSDNIGNLIN